MKASLLDMPLTSPGHVRSSRAASPFSASSMNGMLCSLAILPASSTTVFFGLLMKPEIARATFSSFSPMKCAVSAANRLTDMSWKYSLTSDGLALSGMSVLAMV